MSRVVASVLCFAVALPVAHAGDGSGAEVTLDIHADAAVETRILRDRERVRSCHGDCVVRVPPGSYRVRVVGSGMPSRTVRMWAGESTRIDVEPGDSTERWGGLALGATGSLVFAVGAVAYVFTGSCQDACTHEDTSRRYALAAVTAGGAVAGVVGWILFADGATRVRLAAGTHARVDGPRFAIGATPITGGAFAAIFGVF